MSGRAVPQGTAFHFRNGIVMKGITGIRESALLERSMRKVISARADLVYGSRQFR